MALVHWVRQHDLVWVIVVASATGFCWHHVKTSSTALSSVEQGLNSDHCVESFGGESCWEGMRGWWPCRGGEERKSDRHAQLLSCLWTLLEQHCCLFQRPVTCPKCPSHLKWTVMIMEFSYGDFCHAYTPTSLMWAAMWRSAAHFRQFKHSLGLKFTLTNLNPASANRAIFNGSLLFRFRLQWLFVEKDGVP